MIILACLAVLFRITPISLQWRAHSKGYHGSLYFFLLSFMSFSADTIGIIFNYYKIQTDLAFSIYQISELIIITLLAIELGKFKKSFRFILFTACSLQIVSSMVCYATYHNDDAQELNLGISKLYVLSVLFILAIHYIRNSEFNRKIDFAPLVGILGIFIYDMLSIIPIISLNLQRNSPNHHKTFIIYFFFLLTGNFIRDLFISFNAILNLKKSP